MSNKTIKGWILNTDADAATDIEPNEAAAFVLHAEPTATDFINTPATLVIGPGKVFTEEEVKAILTKVDEVIECYFDTYGHMGGDAHDLQEEFRDIVLKHGLTL